MLNYKDNLDALNSPWINSPFFDELLKVADLSLEEYNLAKQFNDQGYIEIDLGLEELFIEELKKEINDLINSENYKTNSTFFSYNTSPRIVDAGKHCNKVIDLALHKKILSILKKFYRKEPIPFSTINFIKGTEQPLHSDTIHFGTIPKGYLTACWVALEDVDECNGPLKVIPGSHKIKDFDYYDLKIDPPLNTKYAEETYRVYENFIKELLSVLGMKEKVISLKKGNAILWSANLLHGGSKIYEKQRSRYSQVTHYNFEDCNFYFHPFFSRPSFGKYILRNIDDLDLRNLKKS